MTLMRRPLVLGLCLLALAACNREKGADASATTDAGAGAIAPETAAADPAVKEASGPLPPRTAPLMVTAYEPQVIGNVYTTDFQDLILDRWDEAGAGGRYALGQGQFDGVRDKGGDGPDGIDRIEGYWVQATSPQLCDTEREGSRAWGRFQFNFVRDRQSFIGFWSYCDGTTLDRWNGAFDHRDEATAAEVQTLMAQTNNTGDAQ
jgi:hypothetical protein